MGSGSSASTLLERVDCKEGQGPSETLAYIGNTQSELWFFNINHPDKLIVEAGMLPSMYRGAHTTLKAGGYLSYQKESGLYLLPWIALRVQEKSMSANLALARYVPLGSMPGTTISSESSLLWQANPKVQIGLAGTFRDVDGKPFVYSWGILVKGLSGSTGLSIRFLPYGTQPPSLRIQLSHSL